MKNQADGFNAPNLKFINLIKKEKDILIKNLIQKMRKKSLNQIKISILLKQISLLDAVMIIHLSL